MLPLSMVPPGTYRIVTMRGGRRMMARMASMGLIPGDIISVLKPGPGPVYIVKGRTRLAIGAGIASRIFVSPVR